MINLIERSQRPEFMRLMARVAEPSGVPLSAFSALMIAQVRERRRLLRLSRWIPVRLMKHDALFEEGSRPLGAVSTYWYWRGRGGPRRWRIE